MMLGGGGGINVNQEDIDEECYSAVFEQPLESLKKTEGEKKNIIWNLEILSWDSIMLIGKSISFYS